ncbi:MAG: hypothetical protein R3Y24_16515 [Eubacteriales bacterium]
MVSVDRNYKNNIFNMVFSQREAFLSLYNTVNHSNYTDVNQLEIKILNNAIYASYKNDVSYIIDCTLSLYEHQSTLNPNMPLRTLFYVSSQLSEMTKDDNLFGTKIIKIPNPKFVCFYNGEKPLQDHIQWKLSESYQKEEEEYQLELIVDVYNINIGHNKEMMATCKMLQDYAVYVNTVRKYANELPLVEAVDKAINECIDNDILTEFLKKNRMEARTMSIFEYDEEKRIQKERQDAREEGSILKLISQMIKKIKKGKTLEMIADEVECEPAEIYDLYRVIKECGVECEAMEILETLDEARELIYS